MKAVQSLMRKRLKLRERRAQLEAQLDHAKSRDFNGPLDKVHSTNFHTCIKDSTLTVCMCHWLTIGSVYMLQRHVIKVFEHCTLLLAAVLLQLLCFAFCIASGATAAVLQSR
jgi:hypothetical protein